MMKRKTRQVVNTLIIPKCYLPALYNEDLSGYEDCDLYELKRLIKFIDNRTISQGNDLGFTFCPQIDLWADCIELKIYDWV